MEYGVVVLLYLASSIAYILCGKAPVGIYLSEDCLTCMCEASSQCDDDMECVGGKSQKWCGPYLISHEYWLDGGKPGEDFRKCATYRPCAEATIRSHMKKLGVDCNKDNVIDCYDYARIHKVGPNGCNDSYVLTTDYWMRFEDCYSHLV